MKEMKLNRIKIDEKSNEQVIVLKAVDSPLMLPVVIGMSEIAAIKLKLSGIVPPRPLTHDLLVSVIGSLGARLERVVIDRIQEKTFYAKLVLETSDGRELLVDARPSDSVAIALRVDAPIFVDETVLEQAGIQPQV